MGEPRPRRDVRVEEAQKMRFATILIALLAVPGALALTMNATSTGNVPPRFHIVHDSSLISDPWLNFNASSGSYDIPRNYTGDVTAAQAVGIRGTRSDADLFNVVNSSTWNGTYQVVTFRTGAAGTPFRNINALRNNTNFSANAGIKIWTFEGPSSFLTNDTDPTCAYGGNAWSPRNVSDQVTCPPTNWTRFAMEAEQFLNYVAPIGAYPNGSIAGACWNEPYNANFFRSNATFAERMAAILHGCQEFYAYLAQARPDVLLVTPSWTTANTCCTDGERMLNQTMWNITNAGFWPDIDLFDVHPYYYGSTYPSSDVYYDRIERAAELVRAYRPNASIIFTETNWENDAAILANPDRHVAVLSRTWLRALVDARIAMLAPYPWGCASETCSLQSTAITNNRSGVFYGVTYRAMNFTKTAQEVANASMYTFDHDAQNQGAFVFRVNATYARLAYVRSDLGSSPVNDTLTLTGLNVTSFVNRRNGSSMPVSGSDVTLLNLPAFATEWYDVTFTEVAFACPTSGPVAVTATGAYYRNAPNCTVSQGPRLTGTTCRFGGCA